MIRPINDNLIVKQDPVEIYDENPKVAAALKSGIIELPDIVEHQFKKVAPTGTIVAWGPKCKYQWKEGQRVYFMQFGGTNVFFGEEKYRLLCEDELLATLDDQDVRCICPKHG